MSENESERRETMEKEQAIVRRIGEIPYQKCRRTIERGIKMTKSGSGRLRRGERTKTDSEEKSMEKTSGWDVDVLSEYDPVAS